MGSESRRAKFRSVALNVRPEPSIHSWAELAARRRPRFIQVAIVVMGLVALSARASHGEPVFWDDGTGTDNRWENAQNWNPDGVPSSTSDITLGVFIHAGLVIMAEGSATVILNPVPPPQFINDFVDPMLEANSLTISTANAFTVDGFFFGFPDPNPPFTCCSGGGFTSLTLTSGVLTRLDVAGIESDHDLQLRIRLADDGAWDVRGSGMLSVSFISETGGSRNFTKAGTGTLAATLSVTGATNINQGVFRGVIEGTSAITVAQGAVWQIATSSSPTSAPVTLQGLPGSILFSSLQKIGAGVAELSGLMTLQDNPKISVETDGKLTLSGGLANVGNSNFGLFGPGELVLAGPGAGAINADVAGGQLTIAHESALGAGTAFVHDTSGGTAIPVIAFADGVSFSNPMSLARAAIRGLGNSTVDSNITLFGFAGTNNTLDVPEASHTLTMTGPVTESIAGNSLTKTGPGAVVLSGASSFSGGLTVAEGALANNGAITNSATQVIGNSLLAGSGQFADVNIIENGRLAPGASANAAVFSPAAIAVEDLTFDASTTSLDIQLGGVAAGSEYDQVQVSGNATLAGELNVALADGFMLGANQSFRILDVVGMLSGQFFGLGEGGLIGNFGGVDLFITYAAGDDNDVALFTKSLSLLGDYNHDGRVDAADYVVWRKNFGNDQTKYNEWRANFGQTTGIGSVAGANAAVPEPATCVTLIVAAVGIRLRRRQTA